MIRFIYELDKRLHFEAGFIIASLGSLIVPQLYAFIAVVVAAIGKEVIDEYIRKTGGDKYDIFVTYLGGILGLMISG